MDDPTALPLPDPGDPGDPGNPGDRSDRSDDAVERDAVVAATRRWLERAVIGLNLCPFARAVHVRDRIRFVVSEADTDEALLDALRHELEHLAHADPQAIETTLLIHPRVLADFTDFRFFLERAERELRRLGLEGVLQLASFHPDYEFADSTPDDPANHTNRAPYPTLHLLREESIARAVDAFPDAADIYERNIDTLRRLGHEGWRRLFADDPPADRSG